MQPTDLLASLMSLNGNVAHPQGQPMQPSANPMTGVEGLPAGTVPAATPPPDITANLSPGKQVKSLEELLFGGL